MTPHSWIEVNGKPLDIGIMTPLGTSFIMPPIILGESIDSNWTASVEYGVHTGELDKGGHDVFDTPFDEYMDRSIDGYRYWSFAGIFLGRAVELDELRKKYADTERTYVSKRPSRWITPDSEFVLLD